MNPAVPVPLSDCLSRLPPIFVATAAAIAPSTSTSAFPALKKIYPSQTSASQSHSFIRQASPSPASRAALAASGATRSTDHDSQPFPNT